MMFRALCSAEPIAFSATDFLIIYPINAPSKKATTAAITAMIIVLITFTSDDLIFSF